MMKKRLDYTRKVVDVPLPEVATGAMDYWPVDPPRGYCKVCGCPPQWMPMIHRGTGWCCEKHRKELAKEMERAERDAQQQEEA